jgi:hypothetical protein
VGQLMGQRISRRGVKRGHHEEGEGHQGTAKGVSV